jgi:molybdopterin/thiamine biosynthesis adenylyltransferase
MKPWWESIPGRLDYEEEKLRVEGIDVKRDKEAFERGVVRLHLTLPDGYWLTRTLYADFPDSFPFVRPEVYAPDLSLPHHQNPIGKNLCLLERSTENWAPSWTLARLLKEQLSLLSRALELKDRNELRGIEAEQGEPLTEFLSYEPESVVLVDGSWVVPTRSWGVLEVIPITSSTNPMRGFVSGIADREGNQIATTAFENGESDPIVGAWVSLPTAPTEFDPTRLLRQLQNDVPNVRRTPADGGVQIVAVLFPEELGHRTTGLGWLFIVRRQIGRQLSTSFARAARVGINELAARLPAFREMQRCGVAVFGLGCIGAPSALDFARAGTGRMNLLDHDLVEAASTMRWPFGMSAAGKRKAQVIFEAICRDFPWVRSEAASTQIGRPAQQPPEREVMEKMLRDIDLVYDATAEIGVQQVLSTIARDRKLPYVCISGTTGGWGGVVARFSHRPESGCWSCFLQATLDGVIPSPAAELSAMVQPPGCNRLTYVGANYDLAEIALQGVRLGIATLLSRRGVENADYPWDVAVVNLRNIEGGPIPPQWTTHLVPCYPDCPTCRGG